MRYWDPFKELDAIRREVDRVFAGAGDEGRRRYAFLPGRSARAYPLVNVAEAPDAITVEALAPGVDPKTLEISVHRNQMTLAGEKPLGVENVQPESWHRNERAAGKFTRTFSLPAEIDEAQVSAEFRDGILKITLPKAESAKPRRIAVAVA